MVTRLVHIEEALSKVKVVTPLILDATFRLRLGGQLRMAENHLKNKGRFIHFLAWRLLVSMLYSRIAG